MLIAIYVDKYCDRRLDIYKNLYWKRYINQNLSVITFSHTIALNLYFYFILIYFIFILFYFNVSFYGLPCDSVAL